MEVQMEDRTGLPGIDSMRLSNSFIYLCKGTAENGPAEYHSKRAKLQKVPPMFHQFCAICS